MIKIQLGNTSNVNDSSDGILFCNDTRQIYAIISDIGDGQVSKIPFGGNINNVLNENNQIIFKFNNTDDIIINEIYQSYKSLGGEKDFNNFIERLTNVIDSSNSSGGSGGDAVYYNISNNLTNTTNINTSSQIIQNQQYVGYIIPDDGYNIDTVIIKMGEDDISSSYNRDLHYISIENVSNDIDITIISTSVIGDVLTDNTVVLNIDTLQSGTYKLYYENENDEILSNFDSITELTI